MRDQKADFLELVKTRAIMALFSDDDLMEKLVLKGGNLLDLIYGISTRSSFDIDFSVAGDLGDVEQLWTKCERVLKTTFAEIGYVAFDLRIDEKPSNLSEDLRPFWGGYQMGFKIISAEQFEKFGGDIEQVRRNAVGVGKRLSTILEIDISKHEYCDDKQPAQLGHLTIYTYSPEMVACEKLRSICQQMPDYAPIVKKHANTTSARARDFIDIHTIVVELGVDLSGARVREMLPKIFDAKRVPLHLLGKISEYRDYHRRDFDAVKATIKPTFSVRDFDFYFDFVTEHIRPLEVLWNE